MRYFIRNADENDTNEFETMEDLQEHLQRLASDLIADGRNPNYYFQDYLTIIHGEIIKANIDVSVTFG